MVDRREGMRDVRCSFQLEALQGAPSDAVSSKSRKHDAAEGGGEPAAEGSSPNEDSQPKVKRARGEKKVWAEMVTVGQPPSAVMTKGTGRHREKAHGEHIRCRCRRCGLPSCTVARQPCPRRKHHECESRFAAVTCEMDDKNFELEY